MAQLRAAGLAPAPHAAPGQPRRLAIQAARGAALAVHSAAGIAMQVSKEAERLLRAAEGLTRAAAAVLAATSGTIPKDTSSRRSKVGAGSLPEKKDAMDGVVATARSRRRAGRRRGCYGERGEDVDMQVIDDEWADSVGGMVSSSAPGAVNDILAKPMAASKVPMGTTDLSAEVYTKDQSVVVGLLATRPELQNLTAVVVDYVASTKRWRVALDSGEVIAVKREALTLSSSLPRSTSLNGSGKRGFSCSSSEGGRALLLDEKMAVVSEGAASGLLRGATAGTVSGVSAVGKT
jgi:hypothetical protein